MTLIHSFRAALAAFFLTVIAASALQAGGPVLLTVTGEISAPNRGAFDEARDKFFGFNEIEFTKAAAFSFDDLKALGVVSVKADFPKGGDVHSFTGPLLADVLTAAGASGKTVRIQALDGYAVDAPLADWVAMGAVVAYERDGEMFGLGDFGPTQVVFPRAERDDLKDMSDDLWVWSIFHIAVE